MRWISFMFVVSCECECVCVILRIFIIIIFFFLSRISFLYLHWINIPSQMNKIVWGANCFELCHRLFIQQREEKKTVKICIVSLKRKKIFLYYSIVEIFQLSLCQTCLSTVISIINYLIQHITSDTYKKKRLHLTYSVSTQHEYTHYQLADAIKSSYRIKMNKKLRIEYHFSSCIDVHFVFILKQSVKYSLLIALLFATAVNKPHHFSPLIYISMIITITKTKDESSFCGWLNQYQNQFFMNLTIRWHRIWDYF